MGKGYIVVSLFKVKSLLPETQGNLKITNAENGNIVYEKDQAFDISGRSEVISVDTPDRSLSQQPEPEGFLPYGVYNIEVTSVGGRRFIVNGVSVFDNITSIQNIEMAEEVGFLGIKSAPDEIIIPRHQLTTRGTKNRQFGASTTPYVLNRVYIPEYIVVHLGSPNSFAEDVVVGFTDYIKNVASSEIYPTWPEEALRANIYCQISFALNRVYTEWYRSRGYSFQITNSTAYDQYFVKGRNIFENISRIVDDIFNEYIRTIGNKTPFFAQYCNGTTVKCDGLSQWGTVDLANAGMDALDIIKYYFGYDKEIVRATAVEGIPESYPGKALRLNDVNENVKVIQQQLNRISQNFPAIPKIYPVNGVFGKETEDAVKAFQRIFNLTPDGIVGRATWYKISSIYVGVKRLAELEQEPEPGGEPGNGMQPENPEWNGEYPGYLLQYGARGEKVEELQYYLEKISEIYNIPTIVPDGIFGNATREAVIAFQRLFGLVPDGIVGPATWNKIVEVYREIESNEESGNSGQIANPDWDGIYPGYLLQYGARGEKVEELQFYLDSIANVYDIPKIIPDGIFGNATREAVIAFQSLFGLVPDGIVGPATWSEIVNIYNSLITSQANNGGYIYSDEYPGYVLKEGLENEDIKWLQTYLNEIAEFYKDVLKVKVDGIFNRSTKNSVRAFQKLFDLNVTGEVGVNDWRKLIQVRDSLDSIENSNNTKSSIPPPEFDIQLGDKDGYIIIQQLYINILAKNNYKVNEVKVTGEFDECTKKAIEALQKQFGLDITGEVDRVTWNKIRDINEALYRGKNTRGR